MLTAILTAIFFILVFTFVFFAWRQGCFEEDEDYDNL